MNLKFGRQRVRYYIVILSIDKCHITVVQIALNEMELTAFADIMKSHAAQQ